MDVALGETGLAVVISLGVISPAATWSLRSSPRRRERLGERAVAGRPVEPKGAAGNLCVHLVAGSRSDASTESVSTLRYAREYSARIEEAWIVH
jgi:hypothetical protein